MRPFQAVRRMFSAKSSAVAGLHWGRSAWLTGPGQASWTGRRYDRFAEEGYRRNVVAHRCVRLVSESAASMPWLLYQGEREVAAHPLLDLLKSPNPTNGGTALFENLYGFLQIAGNAYLEAVENARGEVAELHALRPDRMSVIPGPKGWPRGYKYSVGGQSHVFEHDPARGAAPILHLKAFHPLDDHYGLSAFEPAAYSVDLHNEASAWNKALLENAARPSGALVYDPGEKGGTLTEAQFDRLKTEMEAQFQGGGNAGRPLLLEGGLSWQQLGFSPSDMDFINARHVSAREIALAFGVPPMLLGIPGDNTYANYQEANRALWRQTILPMAGKLAAALNAWLAPKFGEGLRLDFDTDAVEALAFDRAQAWRQVGAATFLTVNEKRAALGYGPIDGGDALQPVAVPFATKGLDRKGVNEERAARYADLMKEHERAVEAGSTVKTWKTAGDGDVRHSHAAMEGVTVPIDGSFEVGGETLFLPSDPSASLEETATCRCYVAYGVEDMTDRKEAPQSREKPRDEAARRFGGDREFIHEQEGGLWTTGYIPERDGVPVGNSGVTIGAGVDLGHQTEAGLRALNVDAGVVERVKLYLGRRKEDAQLALAEAALTLTSEEAADLTDRVHDGIIGDMARRYDRDSRFDFYDLPSEAQTVIADVAIQYGPDLSDILRGTPRFWRFVTEGEWDRAVEELHDFGDAHTPRRREEARRLKRALEEGRLP